VTPAFSFHFRVKLWNSFIVHHAKEARKKAEEGKANPSKAAATSKVISSGGKKIQEEQENGSQSGRAADADEGTDEI
jgi:hypothetical protein